MRKLVLVTVAVAALSSACATRTAPGTVHASDEVNPFVSIEAGNIAPDLTSSFARARYVIDRATQTCWLMGYHTLVPLECCDARRVPAVARIVTWEDDASCTRAACSEPPAQTSAFGGH